MILFSPCIKPYFPSYLEYSIIAAHYAGFGLTLATKFDTDITKDKLSHSTEQIAFWSSLRNYFPSNLIVTGPTFQWLYELLVASTYVHQVSRLGVRCGLGHVCIHISTANTIYISYILPVSCRRLSYTPPTTSIYLFICSTMYTSLILYTYTTQYILTVYTYSVCYTIYTLSYTTHILVIHIHSYSYSYILHLRIKGACLFSTDLMIFQAELDTFVDNNSMNIYFTSISSTYSKLVKLKSTYHEVLIETDEVINVIYTHIQQFLSITTPTTHTNIIPITSPAALTTATASTSNDSNNDNNNVISIPTSDSEQSSLIVIEKIIENIQKIVPVREGSEL